MTTHSCCGTDHKEASRDESWSSRKSSHSDMEKDADIDDSQRSIDASNERQSNGQHGPPAAPPPPPDGGYGWVCMMCSFFINFSTWGVNSSYGVFLAHYLATNVFPGATRLDFALVGSLSIGCALVVSPLGTMATRILGTKPTLLIGVFFETAAFIGASFASSVWQLYLAQGVCFGFGMGFLFVPSVSIVPQWFTKRRSLANGISASGSGLGGLVYSLAAGAMIQSIGLAWTFRILGIVTFASHIICIILIRDRNKILGSNHTAFDYKLFIRPEYLLLCFFGFFSLLGYVVLIFSLANYANYIGLNASQASIISAIFNLGQALGRPPIGYFSDNVGRINMAASMTFLCALFSLVIWINSYSYGVLLFFSIIGGTVAGTFWAVVGPISAEVVGLRHVPSALNLIWLFITIPSIASEPIALQIVEGTGAYLGAQLFTGFMYFAATLCLLVLRGWKIRELDELSKQSSDGHTSDGMEKELKEMSARKAARKGMLVHCWKLARV